MSTISLDTVTAVVGLSAQIILENGAETYRVEDTVTRICTSYGYPDAEVMALLTGVIISVEGDSGHSCIIRRVKRRTLNLVRVNAVNDLSRRIVTGTVPPEEALVCLHDIRKERGFAARFIPLLSGVTAGCFTLLFGGDVFAFFMALLCGSMADIVLRLFAKTEAPLVLESLLGGLVCSAITMGAHYAFTLSPPAIESILSGAIVPLISGLMMTNAVRDTLRGDLLSGMARGLEALLVAVMVALGISFLLGFYPALADAQPQMPPAWPISILLSGLATMTFCPLLHVPGRSILPASLLGALAYALYLLFQDVLFLQPAVALFIASAIVSKLCEMLARRMRMIATIFLCVALVPLVPGVALYRTMRDLLLGDNAAAVATGLSTLLSVGGIALGAAIGSLRVIKKRKG